MSVRSKDSRTNSVNDDSNETLSSMGSQESHVIRKCSSATYDPPDETNLLSNEQIYQLRSV